MKSFRLRVLFPALTAVLGVMVLNTATQAALSQLPGLHNTGEQDLNNDGQDDHWRLVSAPASINPPLAPGGRQATIMTASWPLSVWVQDTDGPSPGDSRWISYSSSGGNTAYPPNASAPAGEYIYQLAFDLTGYDPSTATIGGRWASDNRSSIYLNGNHIITYDVGGYEWKAFRLFSGSGMFASGENILEVHVTNLSQSSGNPTGVIVDDLMVLAAIPEPTTVLAGLLLLLPFGASLLRINRQRD